MTTHILHRAIGPVLPVAVAGHGAIVRDADGRDYIDASGGAAVSCLGHGHAEVIAAMRAQMESLEYAHTSFFTTKRRRLSPTTLSPMHRGESAMSTSFPAGRKRWRRR